MIFKNKKSKTELHILHYGSQYWVKNDKWHRLQGPAVICADGSRHWYKNNKFHRTNGPALIDFDGAEEWWVSDERIK